MCSVCLELLVSRYLSSHVSQSLLEHATAESSASYRKAVTSKMGVVVRSSAFDLDILVRKETVAETTFCQSGGGVKESVLCGLIQGISQVFRSSLSFDGFMIEDGFSPIILGTPYTSCYFSLSQCFQ